MNRDKNLLFHILESISKIETYINDGREVFINSALVQDAVLRNLQTLSESASLLSKDVQKNNNEIDWRRIRNFRNVIVHDYMGIDLEEVWQVIDKDLPIFKLNIQKIIDDMG